MQTRNYHFIAAVAAALVWACPDQRLQSATPSQGQIVFQDNFNNKPAEGWSWLREDAANWRVTPDGLEVRVQPGNMWGPANNAKNCLVRSIPNPEESPVEISVAISNHPTAQWEQVNLVWYYGDGHMVKLGQELVTGRLSVVMGREEADRARTIGIVPLDGYAVELRLQAYKNRICGQIRTQPWENWREVGECDLPVNGDPKASIHFYNGPKDEEHWARVNRFTVRRLKPEDLRWPRVREVESVNRVANQEVSTGITGTLPLVNTRYVLLNQVHDVSPEGAKASFDQQIYRHKDGSFGWRWDRRASAQKGFISSGIILGKGDLKDNSESKTPLSDLPETALSKIKTLEVELEAITRLENDAGNHNLSLILNLSRNAGEKTTDRVKILFDWYGKASAVKSLNDGYRDYERMDKSDVPVTDVSQYTYRISGFRGAPPRINLKAFINDVAAQNANPNRLNSIWFGNEVWDGSIGATLVTKYDLIFNSRGHSSVTADRRF